MFHISLIFLYLSLLCPYFNIVNPNINTALIATLANSLGIDCAIGNCLRIKSITDKDIVAIPDIV